jgi:hypothetical protein
MALDAVVRRNTLILAFSMALNWAVIVLVAALTTLTIAHLFGLPELAGHRTGLFGAAFGAIGAPIVFGPALAGAQSQQPAALAAPWPIAALVLFGGALLLLAIRIDPRRIAEQMGAAAAGAATAGSAATTPPPAPSGRPLADLLTLPLVLLALLAALVAQAVMTSVMALAGLVLGRPRPRSWSGSLCPGCSPWASAGTSPSSRRRRSSPTLPGPTSVGDCSARVISLRCAALLCCRSWPG